MKNTKKSFLALMLILVPGPWPVMASEDVMDYEAIIDDLRGTSQTTIEEIDPWSQALIHTSIGFATTFIDVEPENGPSASGLLSGVEASMGIDLFSPAWRAEGAIRSFNKADLDSQTSVSLKEFDLKIMHSSILTSKLRMEMGGGLAARYLTANTPFSAKHEYTTPASIIALGFRSQLTKMVGIGVDISLRNSLIDETIDRSSVGGSFKVNALF